MNSTIEYYNKYAERFTKDTIDADMRELYENFECCVAPGGKILDLGCGCGRDSAYFSQRGYEVISIDPSEEMCKRTRKITKGIVLKKSAEELNYHFEFDAVWACASLLHIPKSKMNEVLDIVIDSLKINGVMYASWKYGLFERMEDGRLFSDYTVEEIQNLACTKNVSVIRCWESRDVRANADNKWINLLIRRTK